MKSWEFGIFFGLLVSIFVYGEINFKFLKRDVRTARDVVRLKVENECAETRNLTIAIAKMFARDGIYTNAVGLLTDEKFRLTNIVFRADGKTYLLTDKADEIMKGIK